MTGVRFVIRAKVAGGTWRLTGADGDFVVKGQPVATYSKEEVDSAVALLMQQWPERTFRKRAEWFRREDGSIVSMD